MACAFLGIAGSSEAVVGTQYGAGSGSIWLNNVDCSGSESSLVQCPHAAWGIHNCLHIQDAGVRCGLPDTSGKYKMVL